jgi:hypothetical protein
MKVANPIYDIVFKYMMEDERIARTICLYGMSLVYMLCK